jgi:phage terminase large subunit
MTAVDQARAKLRRWRDDPIAFVRENFQVEPDVWQVEALTPLSGKEAQPRRRLAMKACTGPGKSAVLAWIGWHRLACFGSRNDHPKGAALSGEGRDNLADNLWAELAKWQGRSPFLMAAFKWTKSQIYAVDHPETWFLSARSYPKDADAEAVGRSLSGLHSAYPFILLDEIGDMPLAVGQKATQIFTGGVIDGLIAGAGNPTSTSGLLYHVCTTERHLWHPVTITADPDDPRRTPRVDVEHAREQIKTYGRDNPWVMATILGEFPPAGFNALVSIEDVEAAMSRHLTSDAFEWAQKRLGVDAARFGDDPWVIFPRQGLAAFKPVVMRNPRSHDVVARVMIAKSKWGSEREFFDGSGGYAAGAVDAMIQAGHAPAEVYGSGKAIDPRYFNKRSEMLFECAEWVKRGGALPRIPELLQEMVAHTYSFQGGKFRVEEKDQVKAKIGRSPNHFDALGLTFAEPDMPGQTDSLLQRLASNNRRHAASDFDPYREHNQVETVAAHEFDPFRPDI